jgi:hypothetical protein
LAARQFWFIICLAAKAPCRRRPVSSTLGSTLAAGTYRPAAETLPEALLRAIGAVLESAGARAIKLGDAAVTFEHAVVRVEPGFSVPLKGGRFEMAQTPGAPVRFAADTPLSAIEATYMLIGSLGMTAILVAADHPVFGVAGALLVAGLIRLSVRTSAILWFEEACARAERSLGSLNR